MAEKEKKEETQQNLFGEIDQVYTVLHETRADIIDEIESAETKRGNLLQKIDALKKRKKEIEVATKSVDKQRKALEQTKGKTQKEEVKKT